MSGRPFAALCLFGVLAGCSPEAAPYSHPSERFMVDFSRLIGHSYWPCSTIEVRNGVEIVERRKPQDCYIFDPPRRMRGVFLSIAESANFIPGATSAPQLDVTSTDEIYLLADWQMTGNRLPPPYANDGDGRPQAYAIEFIGRSMSHPEIYKGSSVRFFILDKLLSARAIPPPRIPTREELESGKEALRSANPPPPKRWRRAVSYACPDFICLPPPPADVVGP